MNILVTGGAGFIGSHTVVELLEAGYNTIIVDDFRNSTPSVIDNIEKITGKRPISYNLDCNNTTELSTVFKNEKIDGVIHFAADKAVGESVNNPLKYYKNNIGSLISVAEAMKENNCNALVFSSSCTVYGNPKIVPVSEDATIQLAHSPYGYTKQVCERLIQDVYTSDLNFKASILRYFNPIGAHPSGLIGELPIGTPNNLVPYITQTAIGIREELTVYGNDYNTPDGSCIRDYIHVVDLAKAHVKALEKIIKSTHVLDIFNIGTGTGTSVFDIIKTFEKVTNNKLNYKVGNRREGDVERVYADNYKVTKELNWKPQFSIEDALRHAWKWEQNIRL